MKKVFYFLMIFTLVNVLSCKSDSAAEEVTEENVEEMVDDILEQQMAMLEEDEAEEGTVGNEVEVELEEVDVDKAQQIEQKKEILKEQLKESPNLGKDCESILKDYEALVDKYISGEDENAVIQQLAKWANDPLYNNCKKDPKYVDRFFELEEKMYADEEEDF